MSYWKSLFLSSVSVSETEEDEDLAGELERSAFIISDPLNKMCVNGGLSKSEDRVVDPKTALSFSSDQYIKFFVTEQISLMNERSITPLITFYFYFDRH